MPYVVNPRSGYVVGCNQQVVSSAYKHTIGVGMSSTGRSHRAVEMIEQVIKRHGKFDLEFVKAMQLDLVDSFAREIAKMLVPFAERHAGKYYTQDDKDGRTFWHMLDIVKQWDFKDTADSKGALVFNMWMEELTDGLLTEQIENKSHRKSIAGASTSVHFAGRLLRFWLNGTSLEHKYCLNAETRKRPMPCAYNAVSALVKAHRKILAEFGANEASIPCRTRLG